MLYEKKMLQWKWKTVSKHVSTLSLNIQETVSDRKKKKLEAKEKEEINTSMITTFGEQEAVFQSDLETEFEKVGPDS